MGKLIYSMITSLDGYVSDADGNFGWATPDEELHAFVNDCVRSIGTYLYGRRMYETMVYWETAPTGPDIPAVARDYANIWQAATKIVYSTTLKTPASERTTIERSFHPEQVEQLKAESDKDVSIDGPTLARHAIRAGLVDEYHLIVTPTIVGSGNPFFPRHNPSSGDSYPPGSVRLERLDYHEFANGVMYLRYGRL